MDFGELETNHDPLTGESAKVIADNPTHHSHIGKKYTFQRVKGDATVKHSGISIP